MRCVMTPNRERERDVGSRAHHRRLKGLCFVVHCTPPLRFASHRIASHRGIVTFSGAFFIPFCARWPIVARAISNVAPETRFAPK